MRVVSAGDGYRYLLKSVAAGDGDRDLGSPLTRYYAATGTPPGWWLGSGLPGLGAAETGRIAAGEEVTEEQLQRLLGQGRDPLTGDALGRAYPDYQKTNEVDRIGGPGDGAGRVRRAVAGFDYTFSVPKSVSALWAVTDGATQSRIVAAHHGAVRDVVALLESQVAATRAGVAGGDGGAVAQVDVHGVLATAFDHVDSRAGDPQLHTHVVISNKVQAVFDGRWRSLDSRPMHAATVALSEHYNALLADHLARDLGLGWEPRSRGRDRNPAWEITGIPRELVQEFSTRSHDIDTATDGLIAEYREKRGRRPTRTAILKLRQQATLATRPDKQVRPLAELTAGWRARASRVLGTDPTDWARTILEPSVQDEASSAIAATPATDTRIAVCVHAGQVSAEDVATYAKRTLVAVGERRATWRHWNLHAEASRQTMHLRFATAADRGAVIGRIVDAAAAGSVRLSPPELASTPAEFRRPDGSSVFRPRHATVFTSRELLDAEGRLLDQARQTRGPAGTARTLDRLTRSEAWRRLGADQAAAVAQVAASGRVLDVLVGPAGTGKTTAMRALRQLWEADQGRGSVVGLAPSAAAADVLAHELQIETENTAKWLWEHGRGRTDLAAGQLVVLDEASLAGTFTLDAITRHASQAGAKVLLVGDPHQLDAVEAGGAFSMLVADRREHDDGAVAELSEVRRFTHDWEKQASLRLREGDVGVIDAYLGHDRVRAGETDAMTDATYASWRAEVADGRTSMMLAQSTQTVAELNARARADRITGDVDPTRVVRLHDSAEASVGDVVVTRRNDRRLHAGRRWVRNGDLWTITGVRTDGSLRARRLGPNGNHGAAVTLPADYTAAHVDLGYATTVHRSEGSTVDTAHLLVDPAMTREAFYVAMTRGRASNTAYIPTDKPDLEPHQHEPDGDMTARQVLAGVLHHTGTELSAHQTNQAEADRYVSIAQLAAEYDTIATTAQTHRWQRLLHDAGLTNQQVTAVVGSDAYGPLAATLRSAEADGHHPDTLLATAVARHGIDDADDIAAVLHHRIRTATARPPATTRCSRRKMRPVRIAGLIPAATGTMTTEDRRALHERQQLIETRATNLLNSALHQQTPWLRALGAPPQDPHHRQTWMRHARTIAAYRDRYQITNPERPLGTPRGSQAQQADAHHATIAINHARHTATTDLSSPYARPRRGGTMRQEPGL